MRLAGGQRGRGSCTKGRGGVVGSQEDVEGYFWLDVEEGGMKGSWDWRYIEAGIANGKDAGPPPL